MKSRLLTTFIILLSLLFAVSCGGSEGTSSEAEEVSTVVMAVTVDPDGLDPHLSASAGTFQVTSSIYETLVTVDEVGNILPSLASAWTISEDGLTLTFTIREGAAFSNGRAVDADAVVASIDRMRGEGSLRAGNYSDIESVTALDDSTVQVVFSNLNVSALSLFAYPWAAVVDVTSEDTLRTAPVGSGPYMLSSWVPQQRVVLEKNPYYNGECNIDRVEFVVMPEYTTQVTALKNGQVDIILITGDLVGQFEGDSAYSIQALPGNGLQLMAMNNANEALSDVRVRQAINYAVDKDALIEAVWWGYGEKIGSHFPVVLSEYIDENDRYPYNPEKARELLAEAGYESGLTLDMYLPRSYQEYVNAGLIIADQQRNVGINVNVQITEWATWLSDVYNGRNYDLTVVGHTGRLDAYSLLSRYNSSSADNYINYNNPEFDALLEAYSNEPNEGKRTEIAHSMQDMLATEVPALYIQDPIQIYVTDASLQGFATFPINIFKFNELYFD